MIDQLVAAAPGLLFVIALIRLGSILRRHAIPEDVRQLLGEALALKSGQGFGSREG